MCNEAVENHKKICVIQCPEKRLSHVLYCIVFVTMNQEMLRGIYSNCFVFLMIVNIHLHIAIRW